MSMFAGCSVASKSAQEIANILRDIAKRVESSGCEYAYKIRGSQDCTVSINDKNELDVKKGGGLKAVFEIEAINL